MDLVTRTPQIPRVGQTLIGTEFHTTPGGKGANQSVAAARLGYPVAMAYVDVELTEPGTALDIDLRGKSEPFEVVALPFYKRQK